MRDVPEKRLTANGGLSNLWKQIFYAGFDHQVALLQVRLFFRWMCGCIPCDKKYNIDSCCTLYMPPFAIGAHISTSANTHAEFSSLVS